MRDTLLYQAHCDTLTQHLVTHTHIHTSHREAYAHPHPHPEPYTHTHTHTRTHTHAHTHTHPHPDPYTHTHTHTLTHTHTRTHTHHTTCSTCHQARELATTVFWRSSSMEPKGLALATARTHMLPHQPHWQQQQGLSHTASNGLQQPGAQSGEGLGARSDEQQEQRPLEEVAPLDGQQEQQLPTSPKQACFAETDESDEHEEPAGQVTEPSTDAGVLCVCGSKYGNQCMGVFVDAGWQQGFRQMQVCCRLWVVGCGFGCGAWCVCLLVGTGRRASYMKK